MRQRSLLGVVLLAFFLGSGCERSENAPSAIKFDAAHGVALDGFIDAGRAVVSRDDEARARYEITRQLWYAVGQLNGDAGGVEMPRLALSNIHLTPRDDGRFDATYTAQLLVAWPQERAAPETYTLVLPAGGDESSLQLFVDAYSRPGLACLDEHAHDPGTWSLWYYWRPQKPTCPLAARAEDPLTVAIPMRLVTSGLNTRDKSPEYEKVWEDGRLVVTAIFGMNKPEEMRDTDAGVVAYRSLYTELRRAYGTPTSTNIPDGARPGIDQPVVRATFQTPNGDLDAHLYLVTAIGDVDEEFVASYEERTLISDFVSYSGHSGLGYNIQALARMGRFAANQYQVFLINGCDTLAYVDDALRDAHQRVNPLSGPFRYFDVITNAMPSLFGYNARANMAVIKALAGKTQTYRQLLAGFDRGQRASVMGEEDNMWPAPFGDEPQPQEPGEEQPAEPEDPEQTQPEQERPS